MSDSDQESSLESTDEAPENQGDSESSVSFDSEDEDVYEVEDILLHSFRGNKVFYKIKWKGYPIEEATWEPENNINCPDLLKKYWDVQNQISNHYNERGTPIPIPCEIIKLEKEKGILYYTVAYKDGKQTVISSQDMKRLNPQLAIKYIENALFGTKK